MVDPKFIALYDEYTHAPLDRRIFLSRLVQLAGSTAAAMALLPLLEPDAARATVVPADDPRLETSRIEYPGETGPIRSALARPKGKTKLPAVLVLHENRGLNAHIEDVGRRLALAGFLSMAPDLLSPLGGTPADPDSARARIGKLEPPKTTADLVAAVAYLAKHELGNGKVGAVGFCWGGGMVGELAVHAPDLDAGVVYYGRQPKVEDVERIRAPLLLHYAGLDERINAGIPAFEAALKEKRKDYTLHVYEGVNHAFNNDTSEARYDQKAAELAWSRTVAFLESRLKG